MTALLALLGGRRGALALAIGFAIGAGAMRLDAGLRLIPAAENVARAEVRAMLAKDAADAVAKAAQDAREIEREIGNESDPSLRCILGGDCTERVQRSDEHPGR